jgi:hypothetical protein
MKKFYFSTLSFFILFISYAQPPAIAWDKTYGGNGFDSANIILETNDGGFFIAGLSNSDISGNKTENSRGGK